MIQRSDLALVGKINKTHGINGELSVSVFDEGVADYLAEGACLIVDMDGIFTPFFVQSVRPRGAEAILITFDGYADPHEVSAWVGKDVYALREIVGSSSDSTADTEDGLYAGQLIGYEAWDEHDMVIGKIIDIDESTENVLFVIKGDQKTVYVPVVDEFISEIDTDGSIIRFDLPEGMLQI